MNNNMVEIPKSTSILKSLEWWSFRPRINRLKFFGLQTLWCFFTLLFLIPVVTHGKETAIYSGVLIAFLISTNAITLCIRRLHDMNLRGWWYLLALIPGIGLLIVLMLFFWPGTKGKNRFGDQPSPASKGYYFMFLLYPLIFSMIPAAVKILNQ